MAEDTEKNGQEEQGKKKKRSRFPAKFKGLLTLVIVLLVVLLLSGTVFVAFRIGIVDRALNRMVVDASRRTDEGPAFTYEIPEILVNLSDGDRRRFLSVKFYVGFDNDKLIAEIERRMPEIRDAVLEILWETSVEDVYSGEGKENLREEIKQTINGLVGDGEITGVYFWHVMIQ